MTEPYRQSVEEVLEERKSSAEKGLSAAEVQRRRDKYGPNRLRKVAKRAAWAVLLDQLKSVVVLLLLGAAIAAALFDRTIEAIAIGAAVVVNTAIGFVMEWRATRAMESLQQMTKVAVRVKRDGSIAEKEAGALVPGDIVLLEAGDIVAADLRLLEANRLQCNEAALTGESQAVNKTTEALAETDIALADRNNMAFKGTAVTQGSGPGVVTGTGMDTEIGHISSLVEAAEQKRTPLEKRLDALGRRLVWLTLAVAVVVLGVGLLAGKSLVLMLETALAMAIAAVPEGLPVVATLALTKGIRRMVRRNALVKQLSSVETLGAVDLIFTDKTGTLTENHMTLDRLVMAQGTVERADVDEPGFRQDGKTVSPGDTPALKAALEVGALCNNADLKGDQAIGDPTEIALLEGAGIAGITRDSLLESSPESREVSFDPDLKMMATFHQHTNGFRVAVKGAPEAVLEVCTRVLSPDGEKQLEKEERERWLSQSEQLAADGLRVLALAEKIVTDDEEEPYESLTLVALAGLYDPPRAGIKETLAACQEAGIRVVMGTGDHAVTARAIAAELGLDNNDSDAGETIDLDDPDSLGDKERDALLKRSVFARITPKQKLDLIRLYQDAGRVVAMTGDGVNDAPGLKKADIGIAMGQRGTEVAREAADMVLKDDAFSTILTAIEHGRTIFHNIRRFIVYLLSGNLGEILAISAAAMVAAPLPLLPLQILYINFVSDVMPALALGLSRSEEGIMQRPPADAQEPILLRRHWITIIAYGALIAGSVLGVFAIVLLYFDMVPAQAVTISFLTFGFARLWHVFNMRSSTSPVLINEVTTTPFVWVSILLGIFLLLASVYLPVLSGVLSLHPPDGIGWALILTFSLIPLIIVQVMKSAGLWWEGAGPENTSEN
ncbi:MAG: cation-transporting P-type ATPase [Pseudomonadota bacterium]